MGGFTLKIECGGKEVMFPVNARQLLFLVENGYLEFPRIRKNEIKDKNKANGLARFLTIIQAVWFLVNTIVRVSEGLAITTFELSTLSFIVVMFATSFCWFHKPSDVATSTILTCPFSIEEILSKAGKSNITWMQTPFDFISRREYSLSRLWAYYTALGRKMHITILSRPITSTPRNRIPSDTWLKADLRYEVFWFTFILGFAATLMAGWNLHFPTSTEKVLWRVSTGYNLFYSFFGSVLIYFMEYVLSRWKKNRRVASVESGGSAPDARRSFTARLRNISSPYDPELEISLGLLIPASLLCIGYMVCRMYIFAEEFAGLRQLPASVFDTVQWSNYVPHL